MELRWTTPPEWADRAAADPLALLSDHAHCELRAAASAQGLITHNPERPELVDALARLAVEELQHFRRVVRLLRELGGELARADASPYMERLIGGALATRESILLDRLCVAALVEARSRERFRLLAERAEDPRLRALYRELEPSEEGHAALFEGLAEAAFGERARPRLERLGALEGRVAAALPFAPRMHSGVLGLDLAEAVA